MQTKFAKFYGGDYHGCKKLIVFIPNHQMAIKIGIKMTKTEF